MTRDQRVALSRILCDIVKADGAIEVNDMNEMLKIMQEYRITPQDQSDSHRMLYSEAVKIIHDQMPRLERRGIYNHLERFVNNFAEYHPNAVMLLMAFYFCVLCDDISSDPKKIPYMVASEINGVPREGHFLTYIESYYDENYNAQMSEEESYQLYNLKSQMYGFNLLYLPKLCEEFRRANTQSIINIIKFMLPTIDDDLAMSMRNRICDITTPELYQRLIYEPLNKQIDANIGPTLFINVGTATIPYCAAEGNVEYRTEYLCIPLSKSLKEHMQDIFLYCHNKQKGRTTVQYTTNNFQLKILGFYRDIFNFLLAAPQSEPDLIFEGQDLKTAKYSIAFQFKDRRQSINLSPKEYEAFLDIAIKTHKSRQRGVSVGLNRQEIAPVISHIRSKITSVFPELELIERYKPERIGNIYTLRVEKQKVYIRRPKPGNITEYEEIPIQEYRK